MKRIRTALGETYAIERSLFAVDLREERGALSGLPAAYRDNPGPMAMAIAVVAGGSAILVVPFVFIGVGSARFVALLAAIAAFALVTGLRAHVVRIRGANGTILESRSARGVIGSWRTSRALQAAAQAGGYRGRTATADERSPDGEVL